jgi:hypothetical protein
VNDGLADWGGGLVAKLEMSKPENYLGAVGYGGLCLIGLVSVGYVRKRWWLLFKFGHHVSWTLYFWRGKIRS